MRLDEVTTLTRASRRLGVTVETVRRWADSGRIRAVRDPVGRRLVLVDDVKRLAARNTRRRATPTEEPMR